MSSLSKKGKLGNNNNKNKKNNSGCIGFTPFRRLRPSFQSILQGGDDGEVSSDDDDEQDSHHHNYNDFFYSNCNDGHSKKGQVRGGGGKGNFHETTTTTNDNCEIKQSRSSNDESISNDITINDPFPSEVCFLPDLDALRFWSHPRNNIINNENNNMEHRQQGVLWKRRDIFANRWRPRWFVLHPSQGILTYYLLSENVTERIAAMPLLGDLASDQLHQNHSANNNNASAPVTDPFLGTLPSSITGPLQQARNRASSVDNSVGARSVSENAIDYDVVPRGTIYLVGCTVRTNETLTKQSQNLFALTISPPNPSDTLVHLAARSAAARDLWVEKIRCVCEGSAAATATVPRSIDQPQSQTLPSGTAQDHSFPDPSRLILNLSNVVSNGIPDNAVMQGIQKTANNFDYAVVEGFQKTADSLKHLLLPLQPSELWKNVGQATHLYENLPDDLVKRIQNTIELNLPTLLETTTNTSQWTELFNRKNSSAILRKLATSTQPMLKASAVFEQHSPQQVFELLVDPDMQSELDVTVEESSRLEVLNSHTYLEYRAYRAAWPTWPREFTTLLHWQVVTKNNNNNGENSDHGDQRAILVVEFSCPEAGEAKGPTADGHVRATMHFSLTLLQPELSSSSSDPSTATWSNCRLTKILSMEMGGFQVGHQLTNLLLSQRASLCLQLADYFEQHEPEPDASSATATTRLQAGKYPIIDEEALENMISRQGTYDNQISSHRRLRRARAAATKSQESGSLLIDGDSVSTRQRSFHIPPLWTQGLLLFFPIVVAKTAIILHLPSPTLLFLFTMFLAIRSVVLRHFGDVIPISTKASFGGRSQVVASPVTCRFKVDMKGILRFVTNKKEEREELKIGTAEISIVHIVACAVALALKDEKKLNMRHLCIPWLFVDAMCPNDNGVSVSIAVNDGKPMTFQQVDESGVQSLADEMARRATAKTEEKEHGLGQCLVLATANYDQIDMETDAVPTDPNCRVVAVVGSVRLERPTTNSYQRYRRKSSSSSHGNSASGAAARPFLSLSLTMGGPGADYASCRQFAEEVRKLLQFPEMCDSE